MTQRGRSLERSPARGAKKEDGGSSSPEIEMDGDPLEWNGDQLIFNAA